MFKKEYLVLKFRFLVVFVVVVVAVLLFSLRKMHLILPVRIHNSKTRQAKWTR